MCIYENGIPNTRGNKKRGLDNLYEDDGLLFINQSDKYQSFKINEFQSNDKGSPIIKKRNKLALNKNVIPFEPIESSPQEEKEKLIIKKHSNRNLIKKIA